MIKNLFLPLVCLLVGAAAGYALRGNSSGQHGWSIQSASGKNTTTGSTPAASAISGMPTDEAATSADSSLTYQIKELLVDFDPRSALKAAKKLSVEELQSALSLLASMPKSQDRDSLRQQLYAAWAATDPNAAWKAALADPLDKNTGLLLAAVAGALAKTNPAAAIELAMSLGMGGKRSSVMNRVFSEWAEVDVIAVIAYTNAHPEQPVEGYLFSQGLSRLAEKDPLKAVNVALSYSDSDAREWMLSAIVTEWAIRAPNAAIQWANSLNNPPLKKKAIASSVAAWARNDPNAALTFVQILSDWEIRDAAFREGFLQCSSSRLWTTEIKAKLESALAIESTLHTGNLKSEERAATLARIPEGKFKQELFSSITQAEIQKGQFAQAVELLNTSPDSTSRDRNVMMLGQAWAKSDFSAAAAWLKLQPDSTDRDLALAGYASTLAKRDPQAAIDLVKTIPDVKLRNEALKNVTFSWYQYDAVKAENWMNETEGFSQTDKNLIRSHTSRPSELPVFTPVVDVRR